MRVLCIKAAATNSMSIRPQLSPYEEATSSNYLQSRDGIRMINNNNNSDKHETISIGSAINRKFNANKNEENNEKVEDSFIHTENRHQPGDETKNIIGSNNNKKSHTAKNVMTKPLSSKLLTKNSRPYHRPTSYTSSKRLYYRASSTLFNRQSFMVSLRAAVLLLPLYGLHYLFIVYRPKIE